MPTLLEIYKQKLVDIKSEEERRITEVIKETIKYLTDSADSFVRSGHKYVMVRSYSPKEESVLLNLPPSDTYLKFDKSLDEYRLDCATVFIEITSNNFADVYKKFEANNELIRVIKDLQGNGLNVGLSKADGVTYLIVRIRYE